MPHPPQLATDLKNRSRTLTPRLDPNRQPIRSFQRLVECLYASMRRASQKKPPNFLHDSPIGKKSRTGSPASFRTRQLEDLTWRNNPFRYPSSVRSRRRRFNCRIHVRVRFLLKGSEPFSSRGINDSVALTTRLTAEAAGAAVNPISWPKTIKCCRINPLTSSTDRKCHRVVTIWERARHIVDRCNACFA